MTNINCTNDCIYQRDGKCCLGNVVSSKIEPAATDCPYNKSETTYAGRSK